MSLLFSRHFPRFFLVGSALLVLTLIASLLILFPRVLPSHAAAAKTCQAYGSLTMDKYWLNNNQWGHKSGSGWQCIWDNSVSNSTINWGTNWDWTGKSNSVKTYASAVLGWLWGWKLSTTGLPIQLSNNKNVNTHWNFRVTQSNKNTLDVAYDLWFHTIPHPTYMNNPSDEVMVWLYRAGGAGPTGTRQATVKIDGTSWDLYKGKVDSSWNVFSFVRTSNTTSSNLNLKDLYNNLTSRGWLSKSKYLTSIQAGTEVFIGKGQLDTNSYSVTIR
jgi:xyloglucan-specific endo-beta-1,4-glucanase